MRAFQWLSVLPLFILAMTTSNDWSTGVAALVITPLLWVPLIVSAGLTRRGNGGMPKRLFHIAWWMYTLGFLVMNLPSDIRDRLGAASSAAVFVMYIAWIAAIIVAIVWRVQVRKTARPK